MLRIQSFEDVSNDEVLVKMERSIIHQKETADTLSHIIKKEGLENLTLTRLIEFKNVKQASQNQLNVLVAWHYTKSDNPRVEYDKKIYEII